MSELISDAEDAALQEDQAYLAAYQCFRWPGNKGAGPDKDEAEEEE